jgi:GntR family galactonate operon transcriptional repressor
MEARCIIEPVAAELAAERADARDLAKLDEAYRRMHASLASGEPHDVEECSDADLDFHTALLLGSHNHVLIQLASVIRAALRALFELTTHLGSAHKRALDLHGEVVEAVRLRRPSVARAAIVKILDAAMADLDLRPPRIAPEVLRPVAVDGQGRDGRIKRQQGTRKMESVARKRSGRAGGVKPPKQTTR